MQTQNNNKNDLTTHSPFNKCYITNDIVLRAKYSYKNNDKITVSELEFYSRILKILEPFADLDWENLIIAGGLISGLIEKNYNEKDYTNSDLDFYVYNDDYNLLMKKMLQLYYYFYNKLGDAYSFVYLNSTVVTIISKNYNRVIQIIGIKTNDPMKILRNFDLSHCQVGFNGQNVIFTEEFIKALTTKTTCIMKKSIHIYRLIKAYQRGYSIRKILPEYYLKNHFHTYIEDPNTKIFRNTDKYRSIDNLENDLPELLENQTVKINMNKNYIPKKGESDEEIYKKIEENYSDHITIIKEGNRTIENILGGHRQYSVALLMQTPIY